MLRSILLIVVVVVVTALDLPEQYNCVSAPYACNTDVAYTCGTNGYSYLNHCEYFNAFCADNTIKVASSGRCEGDADDTPVANAGESDAASKKSSKSSKSGKGSKSEEGTPAPTAKPFTAPAKSTSSSGDKKGKNGAASIGAQFTAVVGFVVLGLML